MKYLLVKHLFVFSMSVFFMSLFFYNSFVFCEKPTKEQLALRSYHRVGQMSSSGIISKTYRHQLLQTEVINKYPNTESALSARLEISEFNYKNKYRLDTPMVIWEQGLYRVQKHFLEYHPNSTTLLLQLAKLSSKAYPKNAIKYSKRVISIDPTDGMGYYLCGIGYQLLGEYDKALSVLSDGEKMLLDKMSTELRKSKPYWIKSRNRPRYYSKDINHAKSYLRNLGYDVGKDVDYDLDAILKKSTNNQGKVYVGPLSASYELKDGSRTTLYDLWNLDYIRYHIKRINSKKPAFTPYRRVSIMEPTLRVPESLDR